MDDHESPTASFSRPRRSRGLQPIAAQPETPEPAEPAREPVGAQPDEPAVASSSPPLSPEVPFSARSPGGPFGQAPDGASGDGGFTFGESEASPFQDGDDGDDDDDDDHHNGVAFDLGENDEFVAPFSTFQLRDKINFAFEGIPESFSGIDELQSWMVISSVVTNFSLFVVLLSCVNIVVDTLPQFWEKRHPVTFGIEAACIAWFTLEVIVRFATSREKKAFFLYWLNVIDVVSILPFYIDLAVRAASGSDLSSARALVVLMILRFTKLSRVLKLSKHSDGMRSIFETFSRSQAALSLMFFLLTICIIVGSTAVYFSEQTVSTFDSERRLWILNDGTESPFQSIFHTFWFSLVTITTVGYGDDVVTSLLGKLSTSALMLIGVFVIAFPTVILSSNFHDIHNSRLARRELVEDKLSRMAAHAESDRRASHVGDDSSDDEMDEEEQRRMMFLRRRKLTARRVSYSYVQKELSQSALDYKVPDEPSLTRGIFISGYRAEYGPLLAFQREVPTGMEVVGAREEERPIVISVQPNFPVGVVVNFILLLHTPQVHEAAQRAVDQCLGPASLLVTVAPRAVKRLTVSWSSPHPMLSGAKVVTKSFRNPVGQVPIQLHLPYFDALPALLRYNAGASFHFEVDYEQPEWAEVAGTHMAVAAKVTRTSGDSRANSPGLETPRQPSVGLSVPGGTASMLAAPR